MTCSRDDGCEGFHVQLDGEDVEASNGLVFHSFEDPRSRGTCIPSVDGSGRSLVHVEEDDVDDPHVLLIDAFANPEPLRLVRSRTKTREPEATSGGGPRRGRARRRRRLHFVGSLLAVLLVASAARAQEVADAADDQLTPAQLISDPTQTFAATPLRPQLVYSDRKVVIATGVSAAVLGAGSLVASWAVYIARQNYRLRPWPEVDAAHVDQWETLGAWALWLAVGSATTIVAAEYLLLPEERTVPTIAWLAGGAGLITAAVGLAYSVGGTHCAPQASAPGASLTRECQSGTADALFGPMLLLASVPLLNAPLTYLLRELFAGDPEPLSFTPSGIAVRATF